MITIRDTEIAQRQKAVELVEANKAAEKEAIMIKIAAEAEKQASLDRSAAMQTQAQAEAEKERIKAKGDAEAEVMRAEAAEKRYAVEAAGKRALNDAANILSNEQISMQVRMALITHLPRIIAESVKPMERIDGIKIIQVDGLQGGTANHTENGEQGNGSLADQLVNSALRYRGQAPLVDSLLADIGLKGDDINALTTALASGDAKLPVQRQGERTPG